MNIFNAADNSIWEISISRSKFISLKLQEEKDMKKIFEQLIDDNNQITFEASESNVCFDNRVCLHMASGLLGTVFYYQIKFWISKSILFIIIILYI